MPATQIRRTVLAGAAALAASLAVAAPSSAEVPRIVTVVSATPSSLAASGATSSPVTVTVRRGGDAVRDVGVALGFSGQPSASCGSLATSAGRTSGSGRFKTSYDSSKVVGFCTVRARVGRSTGVVTVIQTTPGLTTSYVVAMSARSDDVHPRAVTLLRVTVDDGTSPVSADPVMITETSQRPGSCGSISLDAQDTDSSGRVTATYTASGVVGRCSLKAVEAMSGSFSGAVTVWQSNLPVG